MSDLVDGSEGEQALTEEQIYAKEYEVKRRLELVRARSSELLPPSAQCLFAFLSSKSLEELDPIQVLNASASADEREQV